MVDPALKRWAIVIQSASRKELAKYQVGFYNQQQIRKEFYESTSRQDRQ
jgi:hypothetical protein